MIKYFILTYLIFIDFLLTGQKLNYYQNIKPIIDKHCVGCHNPNGVGPFSLVDYKEIKSNLGTITSVINSRYMPPWRANDTFQTYLNERKLSDIEIQLINQWVKAGAKEGKIPKKKKSIKKEDINKNPDLVIGMPKAYKIQKNNEDDFRFFYNNTRTKVDLYIKKIDFIPGNRRKVHHSRIMIDTTGSISGINGLSENDPNIYKYQTKPLQNEFFYGWVPGNFPVEFPEGAAIILPKNSNFIFNMHYAPNALPNESDSSLLLLYLTDKKPIHEVKTFILRENQISNKPFYIKANEKKTFYISYGPLTKEMKMLSVQPHAHNICKTFRAFAITPEGDLIPFVKIDDWDFKWQETYLFKEPLTVPKGSILICEAEYDNTKENPSNPNLPPKDMGYGWRTVDEMMNLIFNYID